MRILFFVLVLSLQISALAETPDACREKLPEYTAKVTKIKAEARGAIDSQIELLGKHMTGEDIRLLIAGCYKVLRAVDHWEHSREGDDQKILWTKAVAEGQRHAKYIENLIYRDRASWDSNIKALQSQGYEVKVDVSAFKILFSKDLMEGKKGRGTQRVEAVLNMCSPTSATIGKIDTQIVVSASEKPSRKELHRLTLNKYALEHLSKECDENLDSDLEFLRTKGALLPERSPVTFESTAHPQKVIGLESGKAQRE